MSEKDVLNLIDVANLDSSTNDLAQKILDEEDLDKTKDMVKLFNLNQCKKNVIRVLNLTKIYDKILDQVTRRFEDRPGEFSNADLISYMTTIQSAIDKANKSLDLVQEAPAIQINTQINITDTESELNRDERQRVLEAVNSLLKRAQDVGITIDDYTVSDDNQNN